MSSLVVLGEDGVAGYSMKKAFRAADSDADVVDPFVVELPVDVDKHGLEDYADDLLDDLGGEIETVHWLGHGNPRWLFLRCPTDENNRDRASPEDLAPFFRALGPAKVIVWSCNTGVKVASGNLKDELVNFFSQVNNRKAGAYVDVDAEVLVGGFEGSLAYRIAEQMVPGEQAVDVYGVIMGIGGGIAEVYKGMVNSASFQTDQIAQWRVAVPPATVNEQSRKYRYVAVDWGGLFQVVCKYDVLANGRCRFKYHSKYSGS